MDKPEYDKKLSDFCKAIDIAIEAFQKYPPELFEPKHVIIATNSLNMYKDAALSSKSKSLRGLNQSINEVLSPLQEGNEKHVEYFWKKIEENNIPYVRENRLLKILTRKKINSAFEYDLVTDMMVPLYQLKKITEDEFNLLGKLLDDYETKKSKK